MEEEEEEEEKKTVKAKMKPDFNAELNRSSTSSMHLLSKTLLGRLNEVNVDITYFRKLKVLSKHAITTFTEPEFHLNSFTGATIRIDDRLVNLTLSRILQKELEHWIPKI